jgi:hypothetical protein
MSMKWSPVRTALLSAAALGLTALAAPAGDGGAADCCAPCAPATRKVMVTEWVCQPYETTRTVYKTEYRTENYTAYRTEMQPQKYTAYRTELVPETHTRKVTYCRQVPVTREVPVTRVECVPTPEERTVTRTVVTCKPVVRMVSQTVDVGGHYECREVAVAPAGHGKHHGGLLGRLCHRHADCECDCGPVMTTVQVYVPHCVTREVPVTTMERVCATVSEKVMVTVYKPVTKTEMVKVTSCEAHYETKDEPYTVCVPKQVSFEATRMVCVTVPYPATRRVAYCVPSQEKVTLTRLVSVQVEREVPCETAYPAGPVCCEGGHGHGHGHRLFGH